MVRLLLFFFYYFILFFIFKLFFFHMVRFRCFCRIFIDYIVRLHSVSYFALLTKHLLSTPKRAIFPSLCIVLCLFQIPIQSQLSVVSNIYQCIFFVAQPKVFQNKLALFE